MVTWPEVRTYLLPDPEGRGKLESFGLVVLGREAQKPGADLAARVPRPSPAVLRVEQPQGQLQRRVPPWDK
jgi:hypothetical protein